jgi:hypothetical protein
MSQTLFQKTHLRLSTQPALQRYTAALLLQGLLLCRLAHLCAPAAGPPLAAACRTAPALTTSASWPVSSKGKGIAAVRMSMQQLCGSTCISDDLADSPLHHTSGPAEGKPPKVQQVPAFSTRHLCVRSIQKQLAPSAKAGPEVRCSCRLLWYSYRCRVRMLGVCSCEADSWQVAPGASSTCLLMSSLNRVCTALHCTALHGTVSTHHSQRLWCRCLGQQLAIRLAVQLGPMVMQPAAKTSRSDDDNTLAVATGGLPDSAAADTRGYTSCQLGVSML